MLTDRQRRQLSSMLYRALLRIRMLGWEGKAQQAADLADAFHNVPEMMWSEKCDLSWLRADILASYQSKYAEREDWLSMIDDIIANA